MNKCKMCNSQLKDNVGYIGKNVAYCKEHWKIVKKIIQKNFGDTEKLAKRWGLTEDKVSRIKNKYVQNKASSNWSKLKDLIKSL